LGEDENVGSPEGFAASYVLEMEEQNTAELWANFGGRRCSVKRAQVRRSEPDNGASAVAAFMREKGERRRMDTSRRSRTTPWRSRTSSALTSGARNGVRVPNSNETLPPVGHVDDDGVHPDLVQRLTEVLWR